MSLENSLREPAMINSSSVWLDPMHSNLKLPRVAASRRWAVDKAVVKTRKIVKPIYKLIHTKFGNPIPVVFVAGK